MRLSDLTCYRFKNHSETAVSLTGRTAVCGPNGSGKSNLLEALYFVVNAAMPPGRNFRELASGFSGAFFVRLGIKGDDGLRREYRVSCDSEKKTAAFALQGEKLTRSKYQSAMPFRTMLFSPIEMNVLYLGPSLRRDFVDEPLSLAFGEFSKLKKEYGTALKNRNSLLKKIALGKAKSEDLSVWDPLFAAKAAEYYRYRMRFVEYVRARIETLSSLLDGRYDLSVEYETKIDPADPEGSVLSYLRKNRDRDVILGYTYIGPHLDDFHIAVSLPSGPERSEHYLSRGENKSLLFALKLLSADFLEEFGKKPIVLLFDDLFSELDPHRAALVLDRSTPRQFVVTGQRIPESFGERYGMATVELSMNSAVRLE
jgi:DNA replication and repair protein RecF